LRGQQTVLDSAKDRWDYGLAHLQASAGVNYALRFDLAIASSSRESAADIQLKNFETGKWDPVGRIAPQIRAGNPAENRPHITILRSLDVERYLLADRSVQLKFTSADAQVDPNIQGVWLMATEPPAAFRTVDMLQQELLSTGKIGDTQGHLLSTGVGEQITSPLIVCAAKKT
jgi:hypothetical protein